MRLRHPALQSHEIVFAKFGYAVTDRGKIVYQQHIGNVQPRADGLRVDFPVEIGQRRCVSLHRAGDREARGVNARPGAPDHFKRKKIIEQGVKTGELFAEISLFVHRAKRAVAFDLQFKPRLRAADIADDHALQTHTPLLCRLEHRGRRIRGLEQRFGFGDEIALRKIDADRP